MLVRLHATAWSLLKSHRNRLSLVLIVSLELGTFVKHMAGMQAWYQGPGMAPDFQEAMLWLSKAATTLLEHDPQSKDIRKMPVAKVITRRDQLRKHDIVAVNVQNAPFTTDYSLAWREVLAKTALLLGYLHIDGEGVGEGVQWFKIALLHECTEAERIIKTLFKTG